MSAAAVAAPAFVDRRRQPRGNREIYIDAFRGLMALMIPAMLPPPAPFKLFVLAALTAPVALGGLFQLTLRADARKSGDVREGLRQDILLRESFSVTDGARNRCTQRGQ